jgi:thioredoxin-related protein
MLALAALAFAAAGVRAESALPRPASLAEAAASAAARGEPLVLLASLPGCPYCERIRRSHLLPLQKELGGGVVQIDVGSPAAVVDFDGATKTHEAIADALQARFTPTVMFFGPDGREIAERLVGAGIPDFYGALLEQRLDAARAQLRPR